MYTQEIKKCNAIFLHFLYVYLRCVYLIIGGKQIVNAFLVDLVLKFTCLITAVNMVDGDGNWCIELQHIQDHTGSCTSVNKVDLF